MAGVVVERMDLHRRAIGKMMQKDGIVGRRAAP